MIFEGLSRARRTRRVRGPPEVERGAEALVPPRQRGVDDVLAVAAHGDEPAVGAVHQRLRVQVARPEVLHRERQTLAVLRLVLRRQRLDVHRLHVVVLGPDDLAAGIHRRHRVLAANLEHHRALVVPNRHGVGTLDDAYRPDALKPVVQRVLKPVRGAVPDAQRAVFGAGDDHGELGVEAHRADVVRVSLERLHARLGLVVPDLYQLVVRAGDEVRAVAAAEVLHAVHALLVPLQREVGRGLTDTPHLHRAVERRRRERVGVLGVERRLHHVVRVPLEHLRARPPLVPVPQLNQHVVRARQHVRLRGVHADATDVIAVRLKRLHQLGGVVVVHADKHVVRAAHDPLLTRHPLRRAHGQFRHLERLHQRVCGVVPDVHVPGVQVGEDPRLSGVQLHAFHAVRALHQLALDVQAERHRGDSRDTEVAPLLRREGGIRRPRVSASNFERARISGG